MRSLAAWWLLAAMLTFGAWSGAQQFFYRDVTRQYEPVQAQVTRAWRAFELPLWNASTQGGVPLWANPHSAVLSPLQPLFLFLPFHTAYALAVAVALGLGAAGTYRFARRHVSEGAATAGALTWLFAGVTLSATSYLPLLAGLACLPWQLDAMRARRPVIVLTLWFTAQVLLGDPSTALMSGLACLVTAPRRSVITLSAALLALALCAVVLIPAATLYTQSARLDAGLASRLAWSFHPARLLEWLVRRPWGELLSPPYFARWDLAAGPDAQPFFLEHGHGLAALLALGPALLMRGPLRRPAVLLMTAGLLLSLGVYAAGGWLHELPPLRFFRFPERYAGLTVAGAALLTAHGFEVLLRDKRSRLQASLLWAALAATCFGATVWLAPVTREAVLTTGQLLAAAALVALATAGRVRTWLVAVLLVCGVDFTLAARADLLLLPRARLPDVGELQPGPRVWRDNAALRAFDWPVRGREAWSEEHLQAHRTFASATPGLHGVDELGGYSPVSLRRWQRVMQGLAARRGALFALFNVCSVVAGDEQPGLGFVRQLSPAANLYQTPFCGARAWTVSRVLTVNGLEEAVATLATPSFSPVRDAVLEQVTLNPEPVAVRSYARPSAEHRVVTLAPHSGTALLVVSETWAPGWAAFTEGTELPLLPANGALLGVVVPPGVEAVELRYREPLLPAGAAISACATLILVWLARRRR